jgi:hypothetical protein
MAPRRKFGFSLGPDNLKVDASAPIASTGGHQTCAPSPELGLRSELFQLVVKTLDAA